LAGEASSVAIKRCYLNGDVITLPRSAGIVLFMCVFITFFRWRCPFRYS